MAAITQEKLDKAVAKAVAAETRRCVAAVKTAAADAVADAGRSDDKAFVKGAKAAQTAALANIKAV